MKLYKYLSLFLFSLLLDFTVSYANTNQSYNFKNHRADFSEIEMRIARRLNLDEESLKVVRITRYFEDRIYHYFNNSSISLFKIIFTIDQCRRITCDLAYTNNDSDNEAEAKLLITGCLERNRHFPLRLDIML